MENNDFRSLLRKGIGTRSQAEFAKEVGISAEHLSRMLNSKTSSFPSKRTLKRIAMHMAENITYSDLCSACGYDVEKDDEMNCSILADESISATIDDIKNVLDIIVRKKEHWKSLEDALNTFMSHIGIQTFSCLIGDSKECYKSNKNAEFVVPVTFRWTDGRRLCSVMVAIYYLKTMSNKCFICNYGFTSNDIILAVGTLPKGFSLNKQLNCVVDVFEPQKCENKDGNYKALINLLNNNYYYNSIHGFGLRFPLVTEKIREFILAHKQSFNNNDDEEFLIDLIQYTDSSDDIILEKCMSICGIKKGASPYLAIVAIIIKRETGIKFTYFDSCSSIPGEYDCILVQDKDIMANQNALKEIVARYARELSLDEYGWYYHTSKYEKKEATTYCV